MITSTPQSTARDIAFTHTLFIVGPDLLTVAEHDVLDLTHADDLLRSFCRTSEAWRGDGRSLFDGYTEGLLYVANSASPTGNRPGYAWYLRPVNRHDLDRVARDVFDGELIAGLAQSAISHARCTGSRGCGYTDGGDSVNVTRLGTRRETGQGIWRAISESVAFDAVLVDGTGRESYQGCHRW